MKRSATIPIAIILLLALAGGSLTRASGSSPERGIPPDWKVDHLYGKSFTNMGPRSLAIDAADKLYLAYGGNHLYFTSDDGSGWTAPVVVDPDWGVGQGVSLALDSANKVHISYVDTSMHQLRYATNKSGSWVVATLLSDTDIAPHTALALDTAGRPHILFPNPQTDSLVYVYLQPNGEWNFYPINTSGEGGGEVALAIGSDDRLQTTYYRVKTVDTTDYGCLVYQTKDSGGWNAPSEDYCSPMSSGGAGRYSAIAVDADNYPHIIFNQNDALSYYFESETGWHGKVVREAGGLTALSITVDGDARAHIVFRSYDRFKYAIHDGTYWDDLQYVVIDQASVIAGDFISLVLDSTGHPHAAYTRQDNRLLSSWHDVSAYNWETPVTIDQQDLQFGDCTQLGFSSDGAAHLSYFDPGNQYISYARKPVGGSWNLALAGLHTVQDLNCQHSMKLNGNNPTIAYTTVDRELRFAVYDCLPVCSWSNVHVADNVYYPESVSLAFTSTGKPRISFIESNTPTLAYNDGAGWLTSPLDYMSSSGQTSLAIGTDDRAHVAYFRSTAHDLYYIVQDGLSPVTWHDPQLVDDNNAGSFVSLELLGVFNLARIAYTGNGGVSLRYCAQGFIFPSGAYWLAPQSVSGAKVESPVLNPDQTGLPLVYYYSTFDEHLHYATKPGSSWVNTVLDANGMVGRGPGLAHSPLNGKPALSYYDENNGGIRYLYQINGLFLPLASK